MALSVHVQDGVRYPPRAGGAMRNRVAFGPEANARTDPFLALVEDWMHAPGGFPEHPHRGFETVTLILGGSVVHEDSAGHRGELGVGDVQWMTAGSGVLHSEMPGMGAEAHMLQLWLNLPAVKKMTAPRYQNLRAEAIPVIDRDGARVRVIAGEYAGKRGPADTVYPVSYLQLELARHAATSVDVPSETTGIAYVYEGSVTIAGHAIREGQVAWLRAESEAARIAFHAEEDAKLIFLAAAPLDEPVAAHGPFVMNTQAQIREAIADLRAGRFIRHPS